MKTFKHILFSIVLTQIGCVTAQAQVMGEKQIKPTIEYSRSPRS